MVPPERPTHVNKVAVVRLRDGRLKDEVTREDRFIYRGQEYRGTVVDRLGANPMIEVTTVLGQHLARAKVFEQVFVVARPEQAPDADLVLEGELVRLQGYVAETPSENDGPLDVVAEAAIHLRLRRRNGTALGRFDVGFSFHDQRPADPRPDPWAIAGEVLYPALEQLVTGLRSADVGPKVRWSETVRASPVAEGAPRARLESLKPPHWRFRTLAPQLPQGWRATTGTATVGCEHARYVARQEHRFLRRLGPYQPRVDVWWCRLDQGLAWSTREEFPALYLGKSDQRRWFARQIGPSSWRGAAEDIAGRLRLPTPPLRHALELGPGPEDPALKRPGANRPTLPAGVGRTPKRP